MLTYRADTGLDNSSGVIHLRHKVMAQGIHMCSHVGALLRGERPIDSALPHSNSVASWQQGCPPIRTCIVLNFCTWPTFVISWLLAYLLATTDTIPLMWMIIWKAPTWCTFCFILSYQLSEPQALGKWAWFLLWRVRTPLNNVSWPTTATDVLTTQLSCQHRHSWRTCDVFRLTLGFFSLAILSTSWLQALVKWARFYLMGRSPHTEVSTHDTNELRVVLALTPNWF